MTQLHATHSSNEIDELKRVKEEFQLEMVSGSGLSAVREQFLNDAIALLNLTLYEEEVNSEREC